VPPSKRPPPAARPSPPSSGTSDPGGSMPEVRPTCRLLRSCHQAAPLPCPAPLPRRLSAP
jgi:hypothetical protein